MKMKYVLPVLIMAFGSVNLFAQTKTDTVKVWGNCEECKSKIEKAAIEGGATSANWNEENYQLVMDYSQDKSSSIDIQKQIAAAGYDTQDVKATDEAYKKLPKCCQYKRSKPSDDLKSENR